MLRKLIPFALLFSFNSAVFAENLEEIISNRQPGALLKLTRAIREGADVNKPVEDGSSLLSTAILTGCDRTIIKALIDAGAKLDAETERNVMSAFTVFRDDETTLRFLASEGFNIDLEVLKAATGNKSMKMFKTALELYNSRDFTDERGFTLLHSAAANARNPEVVAFLLRQGLGVNDKASTGTTPLLFAASHNQDPRIVAMLAAAGADLAAVDAKGRTALSSAIYYNKNREVAETLIKLGARVNSRDENGMTPLMHAVVEPANEILVKALIRHGAKVNARDNKGSTALIWACGVKGNENIVTILLKAGASLNAGAANHVRALDMAIRSAANGDTYKEPRSASLIDLLLRHGAKLTSKDPLLYEAWLVAVAAKDGLNLARRIVHLGIDVNMPDRDGITALMEAAIGNPNPEMVKFLIKSGARIDAVSRNGTTALLYATQYNNSEVVKFLLAETEKTAGKALPEAELLLRAASNRDPEVVKLFLTRGADVNSTDDLGRTPLFFAARFSAPEAIKALIAAGADVNICDKYGFSALMAAAEMSVSPETIKILVAAGARIDFADKEHGKTALDFALTNDNLKDTEVIGLLRPE